MKKEKDIFVCSECGYQSVRWLGKCPNCGNVFELPQRTESPFRVKCPKCGKEIIRVRAILEYVRGGEK